MREKWELYLEKYLTKADSYYIRDLLTLAGPLKAPRAREGEFHSEILPYQCQTSPDPACTGASLPLCL